MNSDHDPFGFGIDDGGDHAWDSNHNGKIDIFEENGRYAHDKAAHDALYGDDDGDKDRTDSGINDYAGTSHYDSGDRSPDEHTPSKGKGFSVPELIMIFIVLCFIAIIVTNIITSIVFR